MVGVIRTCGAVAGVSSRVESDVETEATSLDEEVVLIPATHGLDAK